MDRGTWWENSMDRGTWWATVHGVEKRIGHNWSTNTLTFTQSMMFLLSHGFGKAELDPDHWQHSSSSWAQTRELCVELGWSREAFAEQILAWRWSRCLKGQGQALLGMQEVFLQWRNENECVGVVPGSYGPKGQVGTNFGYTTPLSEYPPHAYPTSKVLSQPPPWQHSRWLPKGHTKCTKAFWMIWKPYTSIFFS